MTDPSNRLDAQIWAEELDSRLRWMSASQRRRFYLEVLQRALGEWSPGMFASMLFTFSPKYCGTVAKKIENLASREP